MVLSQSTINESMVFFDFFTVHYLLGKNDDSIIQSVKTGKIDV